jgi:hypothetical protein
MRIIDLTGNGFKNGKRRQSISVNGILHCIGAPVVRWDNRMGLNGYDTSRAIVEYEDRRTGKIKRKVIRGRRYGGRIIKSQRDPSKVRQIVLHHTGGFTPQRAFQTLHNERKLSVQFIVGDDGTIYQTRDALETAWHAGKANPHSIGIECCLYPDAEKNPDAYNERRQQKIGVSPHAIITQQIKGVEREVFCIPWSTQGKALAALCAGLWIALGRRTEPQFPKSIDPLIDVPRRKTIERTAPLNYLPWAKEHDGLVMHMHLSKKKWDLAGLSPVDFENEVKEQFANMMVQLQIAPGPSRLMEQRP